MSGETVIFGAVSRRSEKWRVYRIRTANSTYELEVQAAGGPGQRRCAVLTCVAPADRAGASFEDSLPQADSASLFALSPLEWIGKQLCVGTARTSQIQAVDFITTASEPRGRTDRTSARPEQFSPPPPVRPPFPLDYVESAEAAASVLKAICHHHQLAAAIARDPQLERRFELALTECRLMLEALGAAPHRGGSRTQVG